MTTIKSNKLIAEFMGLVPYENKGWMITTEMDETLKHIVHADIAEECWYTDVRFNESYDWLMTVINKISNIMNSSGIGELVGYIDYFIMFNEVSLLELNIIDLYNNVIEFIEWYNEPVKIQS